jgi:hypothetical protein
LPELAIAPWVRVIAVVVPVSSTKISLANSITIDHQIIPLIQTLGLFFTGEEVESRLVIRPLSAPCPMGQDGTALSGQA